MVSALRLSVIEFSFWFCFPFPWCSSISRVLSAHGIPLVIESAIQILPLLQGMGKRRWLTPQTRLTVYLRYKTFSSTPVARYNRRFCLPKLTTPVYTQFSDTLLMPRYFSRDHAPYAKKILCDFALFALKKCFVVPCFVCSYSRTFVSA